MQPTVRCPYRTTERRKPPSLDKEAHLVPFVHSQKWSTTRKATQDSVCTNVKVRRTHFKSIIAMTDCDQVSGTPAASNLTTYYHKNK